MSATHDKIIAVAAKGALGPLNFQRKGRSRLWFADLGWWVAVVEFQPSSWSKGSYLNVAANWLWGGIGCITFDFGGRLAEFEEYQSDAQFAPAMACLAESGAREAQRLIQAFRSLDEVADVLLAEVRSASKTSTGLPGWPEYNAGIASALVGRTDDASEMFAAVLNRTAPPGSIVHAAAERMAPFAVEPAELKREVSLLIAHQRQILRLPVLDAFDLN
jgi:hypothetical protein